MSKYKFGVPGLQLEEIGQVDQLLERVSELSPQAQLALLNQLELTLRSASADDVEVLGNMFEAVSSAISDDSSQN